MTEEERKIAAAELGVEYVKATIKTNPADAEKIFGKAIKSLDGDCPKESCCWCERVKD